MKDVEQEKERDELAKQFRKAVTNISLKSNEDSIWLLTKRVDELERKLSKHINKDDHKI